ncbi:hypothetical protein JDV09_20895 [Mycobacterium sp. Y57]|uniref:hypothetical protein n=1 Tax=Mycolicibacterium xanthum TaxID=2796469 RepID=UPI001C8498E2|nr:hypothetical protein [Mycolicibacterium xanthum]MBX7434538.1 hypothetical protein [Mycolicibacterium xanthum]
MLRTSAILAATVLAVGSATAVASAEPDASSCDYHMTAPTVVNVSGVDMVTTTVSTGACDAAITFQTVACIQMQGAPGPGQCAKGFGILPAQVFYQPYHPGAVYTATGRGCASTGNPPQPVCAETGPQTATL